MDSVGPYHCECAYAKLLNMIPHATPMQTQMYAWQITCMTLTLLVAWRTVHGETVKCVPYIVFIPIRSVNLRWLPDSYACTDVTVVVEGEIQLKLVKLLYLKVFWHSHWYMYTFESLGLLGQKSLSLKIIGNYYVKKGVCDQNQASVIFELSQGERMVLYQSEGLSVLYLLSCLSLYPFSPNSENTQYTGASWN